MRQIYYHYVTETIGSGYCPLVHQCYHFGSRGFLPSVTRAFHPPRRTEDEIPRTVEIHCASSDGLLLRANDKNRGFDDRYHAQWLTPWSDARAAGKFSPHHSLTAHGEGGWVELSGRFYYANEYPTLSPQTETTLRLVRLLSDSVN